MELREAFDKSLFLFGAGSSKDAGCKMSKEMLDDLIDEITNDSTKSVFTLTEKEALKFLLSCIDYHNKWRSLETNNKFSFSPNIEELALLIRRISNRENFLPYPITGNWADKLISLEAQFTKDDNKQDTLFISLDKIIKSTLLPRWLDYDKKRLDFLNPLKELFELPYQEFEMDLFTLNNDMVIEDFFESNNMSPWRGFVSNDWRGMGEKEVNSEFGRINLYKLHGSLDWVRLDTGEPKIKRDDSLEDIESENIDENHNPYVIFGHGVKTFSVDPFFGLVQNFKKLLSERNYFFVVGYSFFDPYINNLLIEALNKGNKKLIIINPFFGPEELQNEIKTGEFLEAIHSENDLPVGNKLVEYIEAIQQNPFYSEMPEFNMKVINGENPILYINKGTKDFYEYFFKNEGDKFLKLIEKLDKEQLEDLPF